MKYLYRLGLYVDYVVSGVLARNRTIRNSINHAIMHRKMQTVCAWIQIGKLPVMSRIAPIKGPKATTKTALPTMCQPNAAGSFSKLQYSDTVKVKLLKATPRKKPVIDSQINRFVQSVCSATTATEKRNTLAYMCDKQAIRSLTHLILLSPRKILMSWTPIAWIPWCDRKSVEQSHAPECLSTPTQTGKMLYHSCCSPNWPGKRVLSSWNSFRRHKISTIQRVYSNRWCPSVCPNPWVLRNGSRTMASVGASFPVHSPT